MQRYLYKAMVALLALSLTFSSCKKSFLEIVPKGAAVLQTYRDYDLLMNSTDFYTLGSFGIWSPAMVMGDDVNAEQSLYAASASTGAQAAFRWDDDVLTPTANINYLTRVMNNFYELNKIINEVGGATGGTDQQKAELIAEAKCMRAFWNFQVVNYFTKPYNATTASSDLGFPVITTDDITVTNFQRGTVQASYDFMINDLVSSIPTLNASPSFVTRWSKPAAEAFLGKIYLFMGRWADALKMINTSFTDIALMGKPPRLYNYNQTFATGGSFLPINATTGPNSPFNNMTDVTESVLANFSYSGPYDGNSFGNSFLSINANTLALFNSDDLRLNFFSTKLPNGTALTGGRKARYSVSRGSYVRIGVELPDLYLLKAEAEARTGDLASAVADVQTLRQNRMPASSATVPAATASNQTALIKFIIDERTREYVELGARWWDMRRLSVDPIFSGQPAATHTLYLTAGGTTVYTLTTNRLTMGLPDTWLQANPGMVNNP